MAIPILELVQVQDARAQDPGRTGTSWARKGLRPPAPRRPGAR